VPAQAGAAVSEGKPSKGVAPQGMARIPRSRSAARCRQGQWSSAGFGQLASASMGWRLWMRCLKRGESQDRLLGATDQQRTGGANRRSREERQGRNMSEQWLALAEGPFGVWEWTPGPVQKHRGNRAHMVRSWGLVPMMSSSLEEAEWSVERVYVDGGRVFENPKRGSPYPWKVRVSRACSAGKNQTEGRAASDAKRLRSRFEGHEGRPAHFYE